MVTRIQKLGNSFALRIPKSFAAQAGLDQNSSVEISLIDGKLVIAPVVKHKMTLEKLMSQVTEQNLHHEVDTGTAIGREALQKLNTLLER